ncbi:zinc finger MYM-type protein 1-like [Diachasma alloeum]|uniref:zinc finger MYM-type protein 1-like n=1 Tax=Diachasma alloeum TaxID=454923 RepID=UPI0007384672|nr:zinc finger MYM-type protein 1-like [Diachasma alloeum]
MSEHETTKNHLEAIAILAKRGMIKGRIDVDLEKKQAEESQYWRNVLRRVISTIKFLAECGLAFRGDNELIGSSSNGNLLGIRELLAEYDPFLATHLKERANKGSGHVNYLSSTICEQIIALMGEKLLNEILERVKKSKYYSVSVDSTPDEAHIDQLTIIIRYMEGCTPRERFLTFLPNCGHSGSALANALLNFLEVHGIDISDCRGQSYDNAANMAGKYKGMQALSIEKNLLAIFVACCGHSLNLVGKAAANSCAFAVHFINFVQNIYTVFTATPERYAILVAKLSKDGSQFHVPKNLSDTRWSCRADATKALINSYDKLRETLDEIRQDDEQKDIVRIEPKRLFQKMCSLEIAFYTLFWNDILESFNATNKLLQYPTMVLHVAVAALKSLRSFVESKRDKFEEYEKLAQKLSDLEDYSQSRTRKRNIRLDPMDSSQATETQLPLRDKFRVENFNPVIDRLYSALTDRLRAYEMACERFDFFNHLDELN